MDKSYENLEVTSVDFFDIHGENERRGIVISWSSNNKGYGELTLRKYKSGEVVLDSEYMSKEFCIALMTKLVEKYYK